MGVLIVIDLQDRACKLDIWLYCGLNQFTELAHSHQFYFVCAEEDEQGYYDSARESRSMKQ